jgi:hypothetical protein
VPLGIRWQAVLDDGYSSGELVWIVSMTGFGVENDADENLLSLSDVGISCTSATCRIGVDQLLDPDYAYM